MRTRKWRQWHARNRGWRLASGGTMSMFGVTWYRAMRAFAVSMHLSRPSASFCERKQTGVRILRCGVRNARHKPAQSHTGSRRAPSPSARCASGGGCARDGGASEGVARSVAAESCWRESRKKLTLRMSSGSQWGGGTVEGPSRNGGGAARAAVGQRSVQRSRLRRREGDQQTAGAGRRKADEARGAQFVHVR